METNAQPVEDINLAIKPSEQPKPVDAHAHVMSSFHHGHKVGSFIAQHWCRILVWTALIVATGFLIYLIYITSELRGKEVDVSIVKVGQHYRCRGTQGCGPDCPFIANDDPRAEIKHHARQVDGILGKLRDMQQMMDLSIKEEVETLSTKEKIDSVFAELAAVKEEQKTCIVNVSAANIAAQKFAAMASAEGKITKAVMDINNRMRALDAIATIQALAFSTLVIQAGSIVAMRRLQDINTADQSKVKDFDVQMHKVQAYVVDIKQILDDSFLPFVRSGVVVDSPYSLRLADILDGSSDSSAVVGSMAFFLNTVDDFKQKVVEVVNKHNAIQRIFAQCTGMVEGFSNSMAQDVSSDKISALIQDNNYDQALQDMALEKEVAMNHRKFAKERSSFDSGGGVPSVRDDDLDVNPWVGIFGRPSYRKTDGKSAEADNAAFPLKAITSVNPDDTQRIHTATFSLTSN